MERVSVLCLLLLFCSLSGAELLDNEIAEQREASPESANVAEHPHPCLSDVHAVLRDISAKLAVVQSKVETLDQLHVKMEQQQTLNREQAAQLQELHRLNQGQAAELRSLKTRSNVTENQVESLRRDKEVGQVAFSASLLASGSGYTGPINAHTTPVFRRVVSNIGNAYNPNTGFFIAPVRGAYHFEYYIGGGTFSTAAVLVKNGEHIFMAHEHQTNGFGSSANGATLLLEPGDVVFLRLWQNNRIYDNEQHRSTFSGHLLFPV